MVSIVIPAYNAGRYVAEAIESVLGQDYDPLELIVIDDGSTDDTAQIVRKYGDRLRFRQQTNAGMSAALNLGWSISEGTLLGFVGADDRLRRGGVTRIVAALDANPDAVLAYSDFGLIDNASREVGMVQAPEYSPHKLYCEFHGIMGAGVSGVGALFRRDASERAGGWSPDFRHVNDVEFFFRLALQGSFVHLPYASADYRVHEANTSSRPATRESADEPLRLVNVFFDRRDVPPRVNAWRRESTAAAYLLSAVFHFKAGRPAIAVARLIAAVGTSPGTTLTPTKAKAALRILVSAVKRLRLSRSISNPA